MSPYKRKHGRDGSLGNEIASMDPCSTTNDNTRPFKIDSRCLANILLALFVTCGILLKYPPVSSDIVAQSFTQYCDSRLLGFVGRILLSFPAKDYLFPSLALTAGAYWLISHKQNHVETRAQKISLYLLSFLFSFSMVFGNLLESSSERLSDLVLSGSQAIKILWGMFSWGYLAYGVFERLLYSISSPYHFSIGLKTKRAMEICLNLRMALLAITWLPWLIGSFPGLFMGDTASEILMNLGLPNYVTNSVNLIDPAVTITQHHPVLHVFFVGLCLKIGKTLFGTYFVGMQLYSIVQYAIVVLVLTWAIGFIRNKVDSPLLPFTALLLYLFVPIFPNYAVLITKDTLFSCALLVYVLSIFEFTSEAELSATCISRLLLSGILASFLRNGTLLAICVSLVIALGIVFVKTKASIWLMKGLVVLALVVICNFTVTNILYPAFSITPGSQREILSIPIQQVSAVIKYHSHDISAEERETIDKVLDYDSLAQNYNPSNADATKNTWKKSSNKEDLALFIKTWIGLFSRHPLTCLEATMRNYYGYLYPSKYKTANYSISTSNRCLKQVDSIDDFRDIRPSTLQRYFSGIIDGALASQEVIPLFNLLSISAFWSWLLFVCFTASLTHATKLAPSFLALFIVFLICLIGPCNATTYFRYIYPFAFSLPLLLCLLKGNKNHLSHSI